MKVTSATMAHYFEPYPDHIVPSRRAHCEKAEKSGSNTVNTDAGYRAQQSLTDPIPVSVLFDLNTSLKGFLCLLLKILDSLLPPFFQNVQKVSFVHERAHAYKCFRRYYCVCGCVFPSICLLFVYFVDI